MGRFFFAATAGVHVLFSCLLLCFAMTPLDALGRIYLCLMVYLYRPGLWDRASVEDVCSIGVLIFYRSLPS